MLEFIKMYPTVFGDQQVQSEKTRISAVLAKKYSEIGVLICVDL